MVLNFIKGFFACIEMIVWFLPYIYSIDTVNYDNWLKFFEV